MSDASESKVTRVYKATTHAEREAAYDDWAESYERELYAMGYRIPAVAAAAFTRHVAPEVGPILDAGCGCGAQAEPLALMGYGPITGIDLSEGMMAAAQVKGIYAELRKMALGERLDFADDAFAATLSIGVITPGHAPPSSFEDLIRVTRKGGPIVYSLRDDATMDPTYAASASALEAAGGWREIFRTAPFQGMPYGEPEILHRIHVCVVL